MDQVSSNSGPNERRRYPRLKANIQVAIQNERSTAPLHAVVQDISLCGCYVENMFTLGLGSKVLLTLWLADRPIQASAIVVTNDPQLGNGFDFVEMNPSDRLLLHEFLRAYELSHSGT